MRSPVDGRVVHHDVLLVHQRDEAPVGLGVGREPGRLEKIIFEGHLNPEMADAASSGRDLRTRFIVERPTRQADSAPRQCQADYYASRTDDQGVMEPEGNPQNS